MRNADKGGKGGDDYQEHEDCIKAQHEGKKWLWCLHCERVYKVGEWRYDKKEKIFMCHYEGCGGDALFDAWDYAELRERRDPEWPEEPEKGLVYPQYG